MKIAYIGIDLFYPILMRLEKCGCEIGEIFSCETDNKTEFNIKICDFAKTRNIPCTLKRITEEDVERLKNQGYDFAVCAGYYYKIPWEGELPIVNFHPSLLPEGRGSWPMPQTILAGCRKSGVTVHKIAEGFDSGDILLQREFEVEADENLESFMEKANGLAVQMTETLVADFWQLWNNGRPQGDAEYQQAPSKADMTVNKEMTVREADRILRAFYGYECYYKGDGEFEIIGGRAFHGKGGKDSLSLCDGYITYKTKMDEEEKK